MNLSATRGRRSLSGGLGVLAVSVLLCASASARPGFGRPIQTPVPGGVSAIVTADFNGDGRADVAAMQWSGTVLVLLGNGDGTFRQAASLAGRGASLGGGGLLAAGDLTGDGHPDLVYSDPVDGHALAVAVGSGDGTFRMMPSISAGQSSILSSLVLADVNGDGRLDVVAINQGLNELDVWLGNGDGTFTGPVRTPLYPPRFTTAIYDPVSLASADLNHDGRTDLLIGQGSSIFSSYSPLVQALIGNGDGTFTAGPTTALPTDAGPAALQDFFGTGQLDLAIADNGMGLLLPSTGGGAFGAARAIVPDTAGSGAFTANSIASADFDQDGRPDVAIGSSGDVYVALDRPGGKLQQLVDYPGVNGPLAVGDFNGDGKPDIVAATPTGIAVLLNTHGLNVPTPVLSSDKGCYRFPHDRAARVSVHGFPAGDTLTAQATVDNIQVGRPVRLHVAANGSATANVALYPPYAGPPQKINVSVTDDQDDTLTAQTSLLTVLLSSRVRPDNSVINPNTRLTYDFFGFPPGATVYGHYLLAGKLRRTVRMGRAAGPCGDLRVKVRSWPVRNPAADLWQVQFDDVNAYHSRTADRVRYQWSIL